MRKMHFDNNAVPVRFHGRNDAGMMVDEGNAGSASAAPRMHPCGRAVARRWPGSKDN
jgi:hypothetical protein